MFTVKDPALVDTAVLLLQWPFSYALNHGNVDKFISPHFAGNPGLAKAVHALTSLQSQLLPRLPSNESAWHEALRISGGNTTAHPIRTESITSAAVPLRILTPQLDIPLYESVSISLHRNDATATDTCDRNILEKLTQCVWLSSHVALCVLGVARASLDGERVRFEAVNSDARLALRRTWFGVAFDEGPRKADELHLWQASTNGTLSLPDALMFFAKYWRLGLPNGANGQTAGTIIEMLDPVLIPALKLLGNCAHLSQHHSQFTRQQAQLLGCIDEYDLIDRHMQSIAAAERAFQPGPAGLTMGPLQVVHALLSVTEQIARAKRGSKWHDALGHEMASYLASRLTGTPGIRVVEAELRQHMTSANVPLDVDMFVIDERIDRIYAIQCKHFENSFKLDLLDWLERFRRSRNSNRKGLDKAIGQLENLRQLCQDDERIRQALQHEVGIAPTQFDAIRPIVVQNLWNLDFWRTDDGICIYDLHTFCNAIKGLEAIEGSLGPQGISTTRTTRGNTIVDMSDPDALVDAYLNDARFQQQLTHFDMVGDVRRITTIGDVTITAEGLGL